MMTIEDLFRQFPEYGSVVGSEFIVRVCEEKEGKLHIYFRPSNRSGETLDFWVDGNKLTPLDGF